MKKNLFLILFFVGILSYSQKLTTKDFETPSYSLSIPDTWVTKSDNDIINIFPSSEIGAITISEYEGIALSKVEAKKFILDIQHSKENTNKIKAKSSKKGFTEYHYEFLNEEKKEMWITKLLQKDDHLILMTITCQIKYWNGNYRNQFLESFNSFKIK